jgi:type II secretory pathway pseudopilin PulG
MPERLRSVQEQLENLYNQQAAAKAEVGKPFPQEQELAAKTARLIELDMELNLDGKGQPQPEQAIAKSARPSVLDRLKASPVHGAPEKPHKKRNGGTIMKNLPVYKHPAAYAREHDELAVYRASNQANAACKEAIEAAIRDHYRDNRLDAAAVDQVVQQFGYDRTFHVLAITVCQADWDRRYSPDNRAWANAMSIPANPDTWGTDRNCYLAVNSHPGLVDLFLSQTRKAYAQEQQKVSVRGKLKKLPETTSPKISAKSKAPER